MKYFVTALLLVACAHAANAQITITGDEFMSRFGQQSGGISDNYTSTDTTGVRALELLSGANVTWNFGSRNYTYTRDTASTVQIVAFSSSLPLANDPDFTGSTHAIILPPDSVGAPTNYEYITANTTGLWIHGIVRDSAGVQSKVLSYVPAYQELKFPLTYGTTWQASSRIPIAGLPPGATYRQGLYAMADAYGTLQVPQGNFNALRVHSVDTLTLSAPPFLNQQTMSHSFDWYTETNTSANIQADSDMSPYSIGYSIVAGTGGVAENHDSKSLELRISQNPASNTVTSLYYTLDNDASVQLSLVDISGNTVRTLQSGLAHAGKNSIEIDPKSLEPGTYFIHLVAPNVNATEKIAIVR